MVPEKQFPLAWPFGWKRKNTSGGYVVSSDGHIYAMPSGRKMYEQSDKDGYACVLLNVHGETKRKKFRVHQLVCIAFNGEKPVGKDLVRHLDGNKKNNAPGNLAWGTNRENEDDAIRMGEKAAGHNNGAYTKPETRRRGCTNGNSKLTDETALCIFLDGRPHLDISLSHNVSRALVSQIKVGRVWNHVTGLPLRRKNKHPEINVARDEALQELSQ